MADSDLRVLNDRYEIHRRLARGGMAQVYLARDRALDRPVAVKELVPEFATDPSFVERFRREAQAAANLSHPNIVGVYDWGAQDGTYFIVMEFIDGPSLSKVLRTDGPLHPRRAAEIASEVAAGLGFAHSRGVVHRDVKPGNVLLTRSGESKVTDFGIARAMSSSDEDLTQAGSVMGTATYFSPEQAQGLPVDPRSDLYSLGVVLYELVAGRAPFAGDSPLAIAYKHVQDAPEPPSTHISDLPAGLEAIIMKLLSKRPDDRYASAEDLRADLNRYLAGQQTLAERDGFLVGAAAGAAAAYGAEDATSVQPATVVGAAPVTPYPDDADEPEERRSRTALFVGLLVLLLALLGGLLYWFAQSMDDGAQVLVPSVVGLTLEEAEERLDEVGLKAEVTREPSQEFEADIVMSQDPGRDEEVAEGDTVELVVSSGAEELTMPDVIGRNAEQATTFLEAFGLRVTLEEVEDPDAEPGTVVEQSPAQGTVLEPGDEIRLVVATGPAQVSVPDVTGQPLAEARASIEAAGLTVGGTSEEPSSQVSEGNVIRSEPGAGAGVEPGSPVQLVVSSGPDQVEVPNVVNQTEDAAISRLEGRGLDVTVQTESVPPGSRNDGRVIRQDPAGGMVDPGSTVTIVVGVAEETTTTTAGDEEASGPQGGDASRGRSGRNAGN
jgi:beta-lactam-binding protein with PASTA domain/tRNA A-37 threonylcarbamoyl transferase component Bud32